MSEIGDLVREAFLGEDVFPEDRSRSAMEESLKKFDRRMNLARLLSFFAVLVLFSAGVWSAVSFFSADDDAPVRDLILYGAVFVAANVGVSFGKLWYILMQNQTHILKEVKRVQIAVLNIPRE
jgi:hypothetical protein